MTPVVLGVSLSLFAAGVFGAATITTQAGSRVVSADRDSTVSSPAPEAADEALDATPTTGSTTTTGPLTDTPPTVVKPRATATTTPAAMTTHQPATRQSGIYIASTDGGAARRIVGGNLLSGMSFSPDGKQLAYGAYNQVWVAPTAGGLARAVGPQVYLVSNVAWSPSGRYIAYAASAVGQEMETRVLDLSTGAERNLGFVMSTDAMSIAWRPSGDDVAAFFNAQGLVVYDAPNDKTVTFPVAGSAPLAWSPSGDAVAHRHMNDLWLFTFQDPVRFTQSGSPRPLATAYGAIDPTWIGEQVYFVNPWRLDAVKRDGSDGRIVVSDYVGRLRVGAQRPNDLYVAIVPDSSRTEVRRIEHVGPGGGARRVVASAPAGHVLSQFEVSHQGDLVVFTVAGE